MPNRDDRPNVLFFFTDDQRFDTIEALGNGHVLTPTLNSLVERGTTMTNAYIMGGTSGAVCMPSRAMLMTGRTLFHIEREGQDVALDHVMMPEAFRRAGYQTFGTGKWHNGRGAFARCFTAGGRIFFGGMSDHWEVPINDFDPAGAYPAERIHYKKGEHSSDLFCGEAARFIRQYDSDAPFFAYVSFTAPHDPRDTHAEYHSMYDPSNLPTPVSFLPEHPFDNGEMVIRDEKLAPWPRTPEIVRQHIADYYAMITHADAQMAVVLEALRQTGHLDNTIIVFAGDNGLALGRHGLMGKQNLYEHSVHVPLIFAGPGIRAGERRDAFCYLLDIFPTLCELTAVERPASVEGRSLAPVLADSDATVRDSLLFAYRHLHRGVRDERYKLIEYAVEGRRTTQLFDLADDPFELNNLAQDPACAEHTQRLRSELDRWRTDLDDTREQGRQFWARCPEGR